MNTVNDVDRKTVTQPQHLVLGRLAVGDQSIDDVAKQTRVSLMQRKLIDAVRGEDGDLVFDSSHRVVYRLTDRGLATVRARHLYV